MEGGRFWINEIAVLANLHANHSTYNWLFFNNSNKRNSSFLKKKQFIQNNLFRTNKPKVFICIRKNEPKELWLLWSFLYLELFLFNIVKSIFEIFSKNSYVKLFATMLFPRCEMKTRNSVLNNGYFEIPNIQLQFTHNYPFWAQTQKLRVSLWKQQSIKTWSDKLNYCTYFNSPKKNLYLINKYHNNHFCKKLECSIPASSSLITKTKTSFAINRSEW